MAKKHPANWKNVGKGVLAAGATTGAGLVSYHALKHFLSEVTAQQERRRHTSITRGLPDANLHSIRDFLNQQVR